MKDAYIAAKERWARKMAAQREGRERSVPRDRDPGRERLPPGQRLVTDWPVLDLGVKPEIPPAEWRLTVGGCVENPVNLTWEAFLALPQFTDTSDFHCVTTWSRFDLCWTGVAFFTLVDLVRPLPEATHAFFKGYDGYSTNNPLAACLDDDVLVAHTCGGRPLSVEHGGPARVILPKRYAWKGAKWIREITFMRQDLLGFWEVRGYSNTADPWTEDRFA